MMHDRTEMPKQLYFLVQKIKSSTCTEEVIGNIVCLADNELEKC